jgi:cytoplasmic iron level regulating protein YaaA (DUF328/UPF0246 family)
MLLLLSPAKSLDFDTPHAIQRPSQPLFAAKAAQLVAQLKTLSVGEVAALMDLSEPLAALNVGRYAAWSPKATAKNSKPALLAFNGDVYEGLQASTLSADDLVWAQQHVVILSGLYGLLRPLDRLQPYRLEMGTALETQQGKNLYAYWGDSLVEHLTERLAGERRPVIVNLASQEYFKAVDRPNLQVPVVECVFEDWKGGRYKIISFFAKRARGLMARFVIEHRLTQVKQLQRFDSEGYAFDADVSTPDRLVFRRRLAA